MKKLITSAVVLGLFVFGFGSVANATGAPIILQPTATNITSTSAQLNGVVNPNGASTDAWYTTPQSGGQELFFQNIGSGTSNVTLQPYTLTGLQPGTTYSFGVSASNQYGNSYSALIYFKTKDATPPPTPTPTVNISANPTQVQYGGNSTISWNSTNATSCYASGGTNSWGGTEPTSGTFYATNLTSTVTFSISCTGSGGSASDSVTVYVQQQQNPPTVNISANPTNVVYGGNSTISWYSNNATSCNASGGTNAWSGTQNTSGTFFASNLTNTVTFSITCTGAGGSASDSTTVYVQNQPTPTPTVNISANPTQVQYGGNSTISWNSTNATSCYASGGTNSWGGTEPTSGTFYATNLTSTVTFSISCTGSGGSASDSVTVQVGAQPVPNPNVNLSANPSNVAYGGSSTISWTVSNATSCNASGGANGWSGPKNPSGGSFNTGNLFSTTTYSITCTNSSGSDSDSAIVHVGQAPIQNIEVQTNSATNIDEDSATLNGFVDTNDNENVEVWFEWGENSSMNQSTSRIFIGESSGESFNRFISGLEEDTLYYFRAVAEDDDNQRFYGVTRTFRTDDEDIDRPEVETDSATSIDDDSAVLNGDLVDLGGDDEADVWFEWDDDRDDVEDGDGRNTRREDLDDEDDFSERITGLRSDTTYYFRAVARNSGGTDYGRIRSFRTDDRNVIIDTCLFNNCAPTAVTTIATNIDSNSARINGLGIINRSALTTGYFEWGTTPTLGQRTPNAVIGNTGSNAFYASLFSLSPNTTYYFRAVASNQYGTSHGDLRTFRTNSGGIVAGASTVNNIVRETKVVTQVVEEELECPCPELVWLDIETSRESVYPGQSVDYLVRYKNVTDENLKDVIIQVMLPRELSLLNTTRGYFSETNHTIVVDVGNLIPEQEGSFNISTMVNNDAETGKLIVTAANLAYTTVDDDTQEDVFAYAKSTVSNDNFINSSNNEVGLRGAALFGGGFWPETLLGWLILLLILMLLLWLAKRLYEKTKTRRHPTDVHYYQSPPPQNQNPQPNSNSGMHMAQDSENPVNNPPRYY